MPNKINNPDITWKAFAYFNNDSRTEFENMCRQIFANQFAEENVCLTSDPNNPGIEVYPVLEKSRGNDKPRRNISFQAKYFESRINYKQIKESAEQIVKYYQGKIDVVYFFTNKSVDTKSKSFLDIKKLLSDAGIEIELVTDEYLLDLVKEDHSVAEYYFMPRSHMTRNTEMCLNNVYVGNPYSVVVNDTEINALEDNQFITGLISDKIDYLRNEIINLNLKQVRQQLEKIITNDDNITGLEPVFYFYSYLIAIRNSDEKGASLSIENAKLFSPNDVSFLEKHGTLKNDIRFSDYVRLLPETQAVLIDKLFVKQRWNCIIELRKSAEEIAGSVDEKILSQLDFYCSLSYINVGDIYQGCDLLEQVSQNISDPKIELYLTCARILKENFEFQKGDILTSESLSSLLENLSDIKSSVPDLVKVNEVFIASIEIQSYFWLALSDNRILENAFSCYSECSDNAKNNPNIKYYIALCYELENELDSALDLYHSLNWMEDEAPASRCMMCWIHKGDPRNCLNDFEKISEVNRTPYLESLYLYALSQLDKAAYISKLKDLIRSYEADNLDPSLLVMFVADKESFDTIIAPYFNSWISDEVNMQTLNLSVKVFCLYYMARFDDIEFIWKLMEGISDLGVIDIETSHEIYNSLFRFLHSDLQDWYADSDSRKTLNYVDKIANRYISENVLCEEFLQIQIMRTDVTGAHIQMLKFATQLFEYDKNENNARTVVLLLLENHESDEEKYAPYLQVLLRSRAPRISMLIAQVYEQIGRDSDAELYSYRALYYLNGSDDFDIYKSYLNFYLLSLSSSEQDKLPKKVFRNSVVSLRDNSNSNVAEMDQSETKEGYRIICLDSEKEFCDESNNSLNIEHAVQGSPLYSSLFSCGIGQHKIIDGINYTIVSVVPRSVFAANFIITKLRDCPEDANNSFFLISDDNPREFGNSLVQLLDNNISRINEIISYYHFEKNQLGLPIDCITDCDYGRYVSAVKYLLYEDNQALYAGNPCTVKTSNSKFVPDLSTLVILAVLDRFDIFQVIQDDIIIPDSYITFFKNQYSNACQDLSQSCGEIVPMKEGKFSLQRSDESIPVIWEKILNQTYGYYPLLISDEDRINARFSDDVRLEEIFSCFHLNLIHMDALILAELENAVFICDDLFFRRVADFKNINNINLASLLLFNSDLNFRESAILELSKTNYVYLPISSDRENFAKFLKNISSHDRVFKLYINNLIHFLI